MANSTAAYGFKPSKSESGESRVNYYTVSSASARIYEGDMVELSSGLVIKSTGTIAVTSLGVAARDTGVIVTGGVTGFPVYDDPGSLFQVKAQASAANANIGTRIALNQGTQTNVNGLSVQTVDCSTTSTSYPLVVCGIVRRVDNDTTAPGTNLDLLVRIASHVYGA